MCGINGFNFSDESMIQKMNHKISHRGPNGQSYIINENLSLGHARLSIIDLSIAANQPLYYKHNQKEFWIVFNGEIYNYLELKNTLSSLGYKFNTNSDTEVILASFCEWGENCVNHFNGMWALCIHDIINNNIFLSRDRLGVKPLYYFYNSELFIFSSEIKSILEHKNLEINKFGNINNTAVEMYFSTGYIPAPISIFNNVFKLENGYNLTYNLFERRITKKYSFYQISVFNDTITSERNLIEEGKYLMQDSVKLRMRSDVPVGAFLSGGLDSSAVVSEMSKLKLENNFHTFSIGFDQKEFDETKYIEIVKNHFSTIHHHSTYTEKDFNLFWPSYSSVFDEPFGDYSAFPTNMVCAIAKHDVTVVLSGDGGDEIFGGYPNYNIGYTIEKLKRLPKSSIALLYNFTKSFKGKNNKLDKINELIRLSIQPSSKFYSEMFSDNRYKPVSYQYYSETQLKEALEFSNFNLSEALRIYDLLGNTLSNNFLTKVDRVSMYNSIEVRSPFLDYRFIDFSQRIPNHLKVNFFRSKILMRDIIKDDIPKEILFRKKMGFTPPIHNWLQSKLSLDKINKNLELLEAINPELFSFYKMKVIGKPYNYTINSYLIKLLLFGDWFDKWITSNSDKSI